MTNEVAGHSLNRDPASDMSATVICISRSAGSLGPAVARAVAQEVGFAFLDEEIVAEAARQGGLDPEVVADAEQRRSFLAKLFEGLGSAGAMDQFGAL